MRDDSTYCPRRRRFACRIGGGCAGDIVIVSMKQITPLAGDATVCAAKKPDEFAVAIACRLGAYQTLTFLLQRTMHRHLLCSRPRKILTILQRIRLRFFEACGRASAVASFAS